MQQWYPEGESEITEFYPAVLTDKGRETLEDWENRYGPVIAARAAGKKLGWNANLLDRVRGQGGIPKVYGLEAVEILKRHGMIET